ncbi:hypothetical protein AURDEDRAFT_115996 [Auricularia subglabra TFB-10046 SS5]|nr:hypothetical protein AURDEDRAFT_115996 [Auricularia subglabra TFB-10046 SS5]
MLRAQDGGGVPWPAELDTLGGPDRDIARRVWEEKCAMEDQQGGQPSVPKRNRRAGRNKRRSAVDRRASAASSHHSPSMWDAPREGDMWARDPYGERERGGWDMYDRRASGPGPWEDLDRRASGGWEDPMAALERRVGTGWPPPAPPYDSSLPPPPPPPAREWDRYGEVAWFPPAQVAPYDYAPPPPPPPPPGADRGRLSAPSGTKRKRSRTRSVSSASGASVDSQFSYSQPVLSGVHTRVPLPHVHVRKKSSKSPARSRSRSRSRTRPVSRLPRRHSRSLSPQDHRARRRRSRSPPGHYVPNDPRADHWEPAASDTASHGHGPNNYRATENNYRPSEYWGRPRSPSPGFVPRDSRADRWGPSAAPAQGRGCYVCGEWGHEAGQCPNRARAPHLVLGPGGKLTLPDGRTTVCWVWNSGAGCRGAGRRRKSKGAAAPCAHAHLCSLCGSPAHPACECDQYQNRR